jgi:hypothetical protein
MFPHEPLNAARKLSSTTCNRFSSGEFATKNLRAKNILNGNAELIRMTLRPDIIMAPFKIFGVLLQGIASATDIVVASMAATRPARARAMAGGPGGEDK